MNSILEQLRRFDKGELPGQDAQFSMVPEGRTRTNLSRITHQNPKLAGVLILLYPIDGVPHVVLMKRNSYPGVHSDQISFPGGKFEEYDENIVQTAIREAEEEVGVNRQNIQLLTNLTQVYIPPSNFLVTPVLGYSEVKPEFTPDAKEVQEVIETPIHAFREKVNVKEMTLEVRGQKMKVPAYHIDDHVIWGATAMMIAELMAMIEPS